MRAVGKDWICGFDIGLVHGVGWLLVVVSKFRLMIVTRLPTIYWINSLIDYLAGDVSCFSTC